MGVGIQEELEFSLNKAGSHRNESKNQFYFKNFRIQKVNSSAIQIDIYNSFTKYFMTVIKAREKQDTY